MNNSTSKGFIIIIIIYVKSRLENRLSEREIRKREKMVKKNSAVFEEITSPAMFFFFLKKQAENRPFP